MHVQLPNAAGSLQPFELQPVPPGASPAAPGAPPHFNRIAYAAAHVVAAPPGSRERVDWEATLRFRHYLWALGFGVAEAMDTAQREVLGWPDSARLLDMTLRAAREQDAAGAGRFVLGGAGTDDLPPGQPSLAAIVDSYVRQAEFIHGRGGRAILFPTELLPRYYPEARHYVEVYRAVSRQVSRPVFVHWLGAMFAPALEGYFPGQSFWQIMADNPQLLGVKISLLDQAREETIRRRLAGQGQIVLTGDDFNFPALIEGADGGAAASDTQHRECEYEGRSYPAGDYSHALLGILDGIAPVAARALAALATGDRAAYRRLLAPTVPLSRHIFGAPTRFYKAGLVLLAYLNGHQPHFHLLDDLERQRDLQHYVQLFKLANAAGALDDPAQAYERLKPLLPARPE